jgi:hypothetical protein
MPDELKHSGVDGHAEGLPAKLGAKVVDIEFGLIRSPALFRFRPFLGKV